MFTRSDVRRRAVVTDDAVVWSSRRVHERPNVEALVDARDGRRPRSDGHHDTVYVAAIERFELSIRDGDLTWTVDRAETDVADELTRLWGKF
jgi:hypothetical protein